MYFQKSKQSKVLKAKRDIVVYKVGIEASKTVFIPYFISNFSYKTGTKNITETNFNISNIDKGFHSYINIITRSFYNMSISYLNVYKNTKRNTLVSIYPSISQSLYVGKFIIPKGATYCANNLNEVVSNKIIYTGIYNEIFLREKYNTRESTKLWKEK